MHIDLSGLSFLKEQLKVLCPILIRIDTLVAIHLSGMGIKRNEENPREDLMLEILDYFGIPESYDQLPRQNINQYTMNPAELKNVIKMHYKM